jgi:hypothetical protein
MVLWRTSNNDGLYNAQQAHGFLVRRDQALMDMAGRGRVTSARFRRDKPDVDRGYLPTTLVLDTQKKNKEIYGSFVTLCFY